MLSFYPWARSSFSHKRGEIGGKTIYRVDPDITDVDGGFDNKKKRAKAAKEIGKRMKSKKEWKQI